MSGAARTKKMETPDLSPIRIYTLLPETNCRECGERNCLAFAVKLVNREASLEQCPPLLAEKNKKAFKQLEEMLRPAVKEVAVGTGSNAFKIGGKLVLYRHELAYSNPTAIAIDVSDEMPAEEQLERIKKIEQFAYEYIGQTLKLDMIAVRSTSKNPQKFRSTVKKVAERTKVPLILCSLDPNVLRAGLEVVPEAKPLLYAATEDNWKAMADLALTHECPLTVSAPSNLGLLRSLVKTLLEYGVECLALDPGTFPGSGLSTTLNSFTMIRKAACKRGDSLFGFPLIGVPMASWIDCKGAPKEITEWREACLAAMLMVRFADVLILHSVDGWSLLPNTVLRQNIYADPRKPAAVKAGLKTLGTPDEKSPVMFTTNFALTYYTVASDMESAKLNAYLIVVDTGGIAVDSAVAGRKLTAEKVASALEATGIKSRITHRKLIIPGKAARLSTEIEELSGWQVIIGPKDSSEIPRFLEEKWQSTG